jgi:hypothetical protein
MKLYKEQEGICGRSMTPEPAAVCWKIRVVLAGKGDYERALPLLENRRPCTGYREHVGLIDCLINMATRLKPVAMSKALANAQEALEIVRKARLFQPKMQAYALVRSIQERFLRVKRACIGS